MKTLVRGAIVIAIVMAMALAYMGGALVSAHSSSAPAGPNAPAITDQQWAAVEAGIALLLYGESDGGPTFVPLVLRQ
jgi:hypothetical protein